MFQGRAASAGRSRVDHYLSEAFGRLFAPSPLIVARYLKNALGDGLNQHVLDAIYSNNPTGSPLLSAIGDLCDSGSSRPRLRAVLTYNFDDLIETELEGKGIGHLSIDGPGQKPTGDDLPIYHPHGFLPRGCVDPSKKRIVLAEDEYHSQFMTPFDWSNVVQVSLLTQHTCLLVGLSLTDPNMRRLLDFAHRLNSGGSSSAGSQQHYIVLKRHRIDEISKDLRPRLADNLLQEFIDEVHDVQERDAKSLGLSVLWVDEYEELTSVLEAIRGP